MTNYQVGNFLIAIKNAALAHKKEVNVQKTNMIKAVAQTLVKMGYLDEIKESKGILTLFISYRRKEPVVLGIKLISTPGLRIYMSSDEIGKKRGPSQFIISTPKGIISSKEAITKRLGGEIVAEVW